MLQLELSRTPLVYRVDSCSEHIEEESSLVFDEAGDAFVKVDCVVSRSEGDDNVVVRVWLDRALSVGEAKHTIARSIEVVINWHITPVDHLERPFVYRRVS